MGQVVVEQQTVVQCPIIFMVTLEKVECCFSSLVFRVTEIIDFHWGQLLQPIRSPFAYLGHDGGKAHQMPAECNTLLCP